MKKFVLKALDIESEELRPVSLLLAISFFIGVFIVTYDVGTSTLFLDNDIWGQTHLSEAFILSGVLGVIASYIFVSLQKRIPFFSLVVITLTLIFLYVVALSVVMEMTQSKKLVYVAFASLGVLNSLALLSFYGVVTRSFNLKNQKRLTGTVDQGQMIATAIAFFAVPGIQKLPIFTDVIHFLFVSFIGIAISLFLLFYFVKRFGTSELMHLQNKKSEVSADVSTLTKNPYIRLLSLLCMCSVLAAFFVDYSFLSVSSSYYQEKDLADFLAYYGGALTIFSILLQIFIGDRIINTYGVKVSLLILPFILLIFTILSSLIGTAFGYEHTAIVDPILFFIFICLSKLFFQASQETFEDPILKNFFLPIDKNIRHDVQAKIEGVFKQFSVFLAGGLITALGLFHFFELIHYSYFLVLIFVAYAYVVIKIYQEYQNTLKSTLAAQKGKDAANVKVEYSVSEALQNEINSKDQERVIYSLKLMEKMEPFKLESLLIDLSHDINPEIRKYAIERIKKLKVLAAIPYVKKASELEESPLIKKLAQEALENINKTETIAASGNKLAFLVKSKNPEDREYAAKILSKSNSDESTIHLLFLMRDTNPNVRMAAILSAANCKNQELYPLLIDHLSSSIYGNAAAGVLTSYGESVLLTLESAFHRSGQSLQTQLRIIQIYGSIGGKDAIELLWNKIDYPVKKIRSQVLLSLSNCSFRVDADKLVQTKQTLEVAIGNAAWNVAALSEVEDSIPNRAIVEALEEEIKQDQELIFLLLSFMHDTQSIRLVKENIESGTVEGLLYGIELLDVFLEDDIQPLLFPLLEDIPQAERTERLQTHFPRESLDSTQVLLHIINRDYNYINRWTKACALFSLAIAPGYKVTDDLIAHLFNTDPLLRETAAWVLHYLDKNIYDECTKRLSASIKKELDDKIAYTKQEELRIERIINLKQTKGFAEVQGIILADLEDIIEVQEFKAGETLIKSGDNGGAPLFVIMTGKVGLYEKDQLISSIQEKELLGEMLLLDSDINALSAIAQEPTRVFKIEKLRLFDLMSNNFGFTKEYLKIIGSRWSSVQNAEEEINS